MQRFREIRPGEVTSRACSDMDASDDCPVKTVIDGVESNYFMNRFPNPEDAKRLCRILNLLPHSSFPQRRLILSDDESLVGVLVHGLSIEDFCKNEANLFFDEWDKQKVQPSSFYIQIIRALMDAVDTVKNQEIHLVLSPTTVYISVDKKANPHIYVVKYGVGGGKEHTHELKELIVYINSTVEAPTTLMSSFLQNLESCKDDLDTLLGDAEIMTSEERIDFIMEFSSLLEHPRNANKYLDDEGAFGDMENIIKKDAKLTFLRYILDKFGETQKVTRGATIFLPTDTTRLAYRVRFPRNGFVHCVRIILRYKAEALGFRNQKEIQLMFEKHFPGHVRKLKLIHHKLKEQFNEEMFYFELSSEIKSKKAALSTEELVMWNFSETCKAKQSKSLKLEEEKQKLEQQREINQPLVDNKPIKKANPFGDARPREENLDKQRRQSLMEMEPVDSSKVMKFVPKVSEVFPGRPSTWFEGKLEKYIGELIGKFNNRSRLTTEVTVPQKLQNMFIEACNDSVKYDQGK